MILNFFWVVYKGAEAYSHEGATCVSLWQVVVNRSPIEWLSPRRMLLCWHWEHPTGKGLNFWRTGNEIWIDQAELFTCINVKSIKSSCQELKDKQTSVINCLAHDKFRIQSSAEEIADFNYTMIPTDVRIYRLSIKGSNLCRNWRYSIKHQNYDVYQLSPICPI